MKNLPVEIYLHIINRLQPLDIINLEKTNRYFRELIQHHSEPIWRNSLNRQCTRNDVFRPTYMDLSTAAEFKTAATSTTRLAGSFRAALKRQKSFNVKARSTIQLHSGVVDIFYLVPGGRFVLAYGDDGYISFYDLQLSKVKRREDPILREYVGGFDYALWTNVHDGETIQTALIDEDPEDLPDIQLGFDEVVTMIRYVKISLSSEYQFSFHAVHLPIIHNHKSPVGIWSLIGETIVVLADRDTIVWNFETGSAIKWENGHSHSVELFTSKDYIFYVTPAALDAYRIPPLEAIENGCLRVASVPRSQPLRHFSKPYDNGYVHDISKSRWSSSGPGVTGLIDDKPIVFELREIHCGEAYQKSEVKLHRYRFRFDAQEPLASTLALVETASFRRGDAHLFIPDNYRLCDDRLAALWRRLDTDEDETDEEGGVKLAISLSKPIGTGALTSSVPSPGMLELIRLPLPRKGLTISRIPNVLDCAFCPISGRVASIRYDNRLDVFQFI